MYRYVKAHIDFPEPSEAPFRLMKNGHTSYCLYQPVRDTAVMMCLYQIDNATSQHCMTTLLEENCVCMLYRNKSRKANTLFSFLFNYSAYSFFFLQGNTKISFINMWTA